MKTAPRWYTTIYWLNNVYTIQWQIAFWKYKYKIVKIDLSFRKCIIYYGLSYLVLTQEQVISMGQFEKQLQILIIGNENKNITYLIWQIFTRTPFSITYWKTMVSFVAYLFTKMKKSGFSALNLFSIQSKRLMKLCIDLILPPGKYIYALLKVGDNLPRLDNAVVFEAAAAQSLLFISVEFFKCWTKL